MNFLWDRCGGENFQIVGGIISIRRSLLQSTALDASNPKKAGFCRVIPESRGQISSYLFFLFLFLLDILKKRRFRPNHRDQPPCVCPLFDWMSLPICHSPPQSRPLFPCSPRCALFMCTAPTPPTPHLFIAIRKDVFRRDRASEAQNPTPACLSAGTLNSHWIPCTVIPGLCPTHHPTHHHLAKHFYLYL